MLNFYWTTVRFPKQSDTVFKTRTCLDVHLLESNNNLIKHCTCISRSGYIIEEDDVSDSKKTTTELQNIILQLNQQIFRQNIICS
jgi:hypothetical protein